MKVLIVGSGHGGCAVASYCAQQSHEVTLLKIGKTKHNENFEYLLEKKKIRVIEGDKTLEVSLFNVTRDIQKAVVWADLIVIAYVSNYHEYIASLICPYIHYGQLIYICPGYAGSLIFKNHLENYGQLDGIILAEGETLPFSSRIIEKGIVEIYSQNYGHPIAVFPKENMEEAIQKLQCILPGKCIPRNNALEVALHNPNLIIHTIGIVMNAARVEMDSNGFALYKDGFSPAIWRVVEAMDKEKISVLEGIGAPGRTYFEEFLIRTFPDPEKFTSEQGFEHYAQEVYSLRTTNLNDRYIVEDVPIGLGLLHSLGKYLNIPTPTCDSIIHLAGLLVEKQFFAEARTVECLGIDNAEKLIYTIKPVAYKDHYKNEYTFRKRA